MSQPSATPRNDLIVGDCIRTMRSWPEAAVDLIFADPPYNIGYTYDQYEDTRNDEDYLRWTRDWIDGCARLLKPTGSLYILIGDEYAAETRLHLKDLERQRKLAFRNWVVWHYTFGQNCKLKFNRSHAHLFYCVGSAVFEKKGGSKNGSRVSGLGSREESEAVHPETSHLEKEKQPNTAASPLDPRPQTRGPIAPFTFNRQAVAVPSARQTTYGDLRANPAGKLPDDTWYLRPQEADGVYFRPGEDTWYHSRLCGTFKERQGWHPCQLPESLLERIILVSSNPGDLVFDPFAGSGTTLAAAARLKRDWLGCELSDEYARLARDRVEHAAATGQVRQTTLADKGIVRGRPKKKAEPHRSAGLYK